MHFVTKLTIYLLYSVITFTKVCCVEVYSNHLLELVFISTVGCVLGFSKPSESGHVSVHHVQNQKVAMWLFIKVVSVKLYLFQIFVANF